MKKRKNSKSIAIKITALLIFLILVSLKASSFSANGTGKTFDFAVTSGKNAVASGSSFKTFTVVGDITSVVNSSLFRTELGFLRTLPYLDGESCQVNLECVGGFCCSNACSSSSCPTDSTPSEAAAGTAG